MESMLGYSRINHHSESAMGQTSFPLFRPAVEEPPEDLVFSVSQALYHEVKRAALIGPDPAAIERVRLTLDVSVHTIDALQALATATGSSRRAMATKLLDAAVWEAVNDLSQNAQGAQAIPEYEAVLFEFEEAYNSLRAQRLEDEAA
jgi:hypothetical protein